MRLTESRLRQIIREELENRESLSELRFVKSLYRDFVGQTKYLKDLDKLLQLYLYDHTFGQFRTLENLASSIVISMKSFGVNHMRPDRGNIPLFDHEAFRAAFDRVIARPRDQRAKEALDQMVREARETIRDFIKGA